jgi:hypothetical protein
MFREQKEKIMKQMTQLCAGTLLIHPEVLQAAAIGHGAPLTVKAETGRIIIETHAEPEAPANRESRVILFGRIDDLLLSGEGG